LSTTAPAITLAGVSRRFLVDRRRAAGRRGSWPRRRTVSEELWALRDVTLEVPPGETLGLLGANGSGKSTLLGLVAGILPPAGGQVRVRGRVGSLLELGAGFNGELTGRENVYLNASLLGMPRREAARRFDEIVAFAELGPFIDTQVKHYSSGMYVRLGFAVAVHTDPDVLLVDEVLAVGDDAYQRKCLAKVAELQARGRTIVFVTHALDLVPQVCHRAVVLDRGRLVADGDPAAAAATLRRRLGDGPGGNGPDGPHIGEFGPSTPPPARPRPPSGPANPSPSRCSSPIGRAPSRSRPRSSCSGRPTWWSRPPGRPWSPVPACDSRWRPYRSCGGGSPWRPASGIRRPAPSATRRLRDAFRVDGSDTGGILQVSWSAAQPGPVPVGSWSGRP
jgi:ABC-2 type transport system ATP-binding protein